MYDSGEESGGGTQIKCLGFECIKEPSVDEPETEDLEVGLPPVGYHQFLNGRLRGGSLPLRQYLLLVLGVVPIVLCVYPLLVFEVLHSVVLGKRFLEVAFMKGA